MKLLLSNDDGINASGLNALYHILKSEYEVMVLAPDRDRSGVSNSLTLDRPLQTIQLAQDRYSLDGTPTDCVHLGTSGVLPFIPNQVVSGINHGANLGDDVLYSGTVAAAMEGRFLQNPAFAFSLVTADGARKETTIERFLPFARLAAKILRHAHQWDLPARTVLNINFPDRAIEDIKGLALTTLGQRLKGENPISTQNPRGKTLYWIGRAGGPVARNPGNDFHAVEDGWISLTPLHADMSSVLASAILSEKLALYHVDPFANLTSEPSQSNMDKDEPETL
jgi:5'-nucleotidase